MMSTRKRIGISLFAVLLMSIAAFAIAFFLPQKSVYAAEDPSSYTGITAELRRDEENNIVDAEGENVRIFANSSEFSLDDLKQVLIVKAAPVGGGEAVELTAEDYELSGSLTVIGDNEITVTFGTHPRRGSRTGKTCDRHIRIEWGHDFCNGYHRRIQRVYQSDGRAERRFRIRRGSGDQRLSDFRRNASWIADFPRYLRERFGHF